MAEDDSSSRPILCRFFKSSCTPFWVRVCSGFAQDKNHMAQSDTRLQGVNSLAGAIVRQLPQRCLAFCSRAAVATAHQAHALHWVRVEWCSAAVEHETRLHSLPQWFVCNMAAGKTAQNIGIVVQGAGERPCEVRSATPWCTEAGGMHEPFDAHLGVHWLLGCLMGCDERLQRTQEAPLTTGSTRALACVAAAQEESQEGCAGEEALQRCVCKAAVAAVCQACGLACTQPMSVHARQVHCVAYTYHMIHITQILRRCSCGGYGGVLPG